MDENKFAEIMQQRTDSELFEIVTKLRDYYQPDAVVAAETEFKKRNLSTVQIDDIEKEVSQKQKNNEERVNKPLDTHWRILCMIFPGLINFFLAFIFKGQGYERKFKETWRWTLYGFGAYFGATLTMMLIFRLLS